jgi:SAM-dependent methyltransferase
MLKPRSRNGKYWYPWYSHPMARVLKFQMLLAYLNEIPRGDKVLDYGSGDRPYEELFLTKFGEYLAADYAAANLKHARRPELYIENNHVPLSNASVDCVVLTEVLEHIYDPKSALAEIHRLLKPGGHILGSVPFVIGEHESPFDYHRYTSFCLRKMFEDSGFEVLHLDYVGEAIGVLVSTISTMVGIVPKGLKRAGMNWLGASVGFVLKFPEYLYLLACRTRVNPQRWERCRVLPLGFTFLIKKRSGG